MNTRARCTSCGRSGNTRGRQDAYMCRPCRGLPTLAEAAERKRIDQLTRKSRTYDNEPIELTGGRWVQDGWIQRWEVAS